MTINVEIGKKAKKLSSKRGSIITIENELLVVTLKVTWFNRNCHGGCHFGFFLCVTCYSFLNVNDFHLKKYYEYFISIKYALYVGYSPCEKSLQNDIHHSLLSHSNQSIWQPRGNTRRP